MAATGKITQVIGSTFDAEFPEDQLPAIYNAITIDAQNDGQSVGRADSVRPTRGFGCGQSIDREKRRTRRDERKHLCPRPARSPR